jgi:hypothetical protein
MKLLETRVLHTVLVRDAVVTGQGRLGSKLADRQPPEPLSLGHFPLPTYSDDHAPAWPSPIRIPPMGNAPANAFAERAGRPEWGFGHSGSRSLARSASQTVAKRFAGSAPRNANANPQATRLSVGQTFDGHAPMCPTGAMRAVSTRGPR